MEALHIHVFPANPMLGSRVGLVFLTILECCWSQGVRFRRLCVFRRMCDGSHTLPSCARGNVSLGAQKPFVTGKARNQVDALLFACKRNVCVSHSFPAFHK